MLKGDLAGSPLSEVLRQLADGAATGCLHVLDAADEKAQVYLRGGRVYAVVAPGKRPALGSRLVSSGALAPEALAEALEAQRTELQGWRLGELLVHLGYVDQPVVEDFVNEQVRASLSDLLPWRHATWKFRVNERTREDVAPPVEVDVLLGEIEARQDLWTQMEQVLHGPHAIPMLSAGDTASDETEIEPDAWSLLCKVDGVRSVADLARECGFTLHEAAQVVVRLVTAGLLEVEEAEDEVAVEPAEQAPLPPREVASRLASALTGLGVPTQHGQEARGITRPPHEDDLAGSISRVSESLSALLGPATASDDVFGAPVHRPLTPKVTPVEPEDPRRVERERRTAARRERDGAELAAAQAELEAARAAHEAEFALEHGQDHVAEVVDLSSVRAAAEALAEAEATRVEEEAARLAEEERVSAEAAAAEEARLAAEAEAADETRLAEEARASAETAAAAAEARLAAEAEAAEEARLAEQARLAEAEAAEAARLAADARASAEAAAAEEARLAAENDAAEQMRREQEHQAAEQARRVQEDAARRAQEAVAVAEFAALTADLAAEQDDDSANDFDAETHAAAFAELSASASHSVPSPAPPAAVAPPAPEPEELEAYEPAASFVHDTDTASLLRELSSLGLDDDAPPPPVTRPASPRPVSMIPVKKRKGLFGRG